MLDRNGLYASACRTFITSHQSTQARPERLGRDLEGRWPPPYQRSVGGWCGRSQLASSVQLGPRRHRLPLWRHGHLVIRGLHYRVDPM